jgi:hypothetical protein
MKMMKNLVAELIDTAAAIACMAIGAGFIYVIHLLIG